MKFKVTFKDPDTLDDTIRDAVKANLGSIQGIDEGEREALVDGRCEKVSIACGRWFEHGEYLTVEVDTEAGTCVVVPVK